MTEITILKMNLLGGMDSYIKECGDENIINAWLSAGVPDGADETDLREIAEDEELWLDCVNAFANCCKAMGII